MKTKYILIVAAFVSLTANAQSQSQPFNIEWQKTYGGSDLEENDYLGHTITATSDGGYIFIGNTKSNDGDVSGNHGKWDVWVVKIDGTGIIQWQKCVGGNQEDFGRFVISTSDAGCLVGGQTYSNNGDMKGNHGGADAFVIKLNSAGIVEWEKTLGSNKEDHMQDAVQNPDGSYILAGLTYGNNGDVTGNHGGQDAWVVKLGQSGTIIWQRCYGGSGKDGDEHTTKIIRCTEGGYILSTNSSSTNGDVSGFHGDVGQFIGDAWVVKLDNGGNIQWNKCFGGTYWDYFENITQLSNGDYIASGGTRGAASGDSPGSYGETLFPDWWVIRFSQAGDLIWSRHYGGTGAEVLHGKIFVLSNGDMIFPSGSRSNDHDCTGINGLPDVWIVKTDSLGNILSYNIFGGIGYENMSYAVMKNDGSLTAAAITDPTDINNNGGGGHDANGQLWILHLIPNPADTFAITTTSLSQTASCSNSASFNIDVTYDKRGTFNAGNVFTAELSDGDGSFTSPTIVGSVHSTSSGTISCTIPSGLLPSRYYSIRIKSSNPQFTGITSGHFLNIQSCTSKLSGNTKTDNFTTLNIVPNPITNSSTISFYLSQSENVSLKIFDLNGRLVATLVDKPFEMGENNIEWNVVGVSAGIYLMRFQTAEKLETKKIIVMR